MTARGHVQRTDDTVRPPTPRHDAPKAADGHQIETDTPRCAINYLLNPCAEDAAISEHASSVTTPSVSLAPGVQYAGATPQTAMAPASQAQAQPATTDPARRNVEAPVTRLTRPKPPEDLPHRPHDSADISRQDLAESRRSLDFRKTMQGSADAFMDTRWRNRQLQKAKASTRKTTSNGRIPASSPKKTGKGRVKKVTVSRKRTTRDREGAQLHQMEMILCNRGHSGSLTPQTNGNFRKSGLRYEKQSILLRANEILEADLAPYKRGIEMDSGDKCTCKAFLTRFHEDPNERTPQLPQEA